MSRPNRLQKGRADNRSTPDSGADAALERDRRDLDRRHADVLKTAAFLEKIPQATWLEAMVELEIAPH